MHVFSFSLSPSSCIDLLSLLPPNGTNESKSIINARRLYDSCVNEEAIEANGANAMLSLINIELGGWPILQGSTWNNSTFNFSNLLLKLVEYGSYIIYAVGTEVDNKNSSVNLIRVSRFLVSMH